MKKRKTKAARSSRTRAAGCKNCKGPTKGFKCDVCGAVASVHVPTHKCGGKHCMPKCVGCGCAEVLCKC